MSNIIAVIWDFDKTLVDGYMQDPIFEKYGVDAKKFWEEVNFLSDKYWDEQKVKVNKDTIYLNHFINKTKEGVFKGLNNDLLFELGKELKFYKGIPEIFEKTKKIVEENSVFQEYNIKVEHYIVSTGMKNMIYIADGPSDVPAFSVIKKGGGSTFAIYPKSNQKAFKQVEKLREDNRVDMYAEADYSEGTTTYMWITNKIEELAQNIVNEEKSKLEASISDSPKHLT